MSAHSPEPMPDEQMGPVTPPRSGRGTAPVEALLKGLRKAVADSETEWIDANVVRLLLGRYDNHDAVVAEAFADAGRETTHRWTPDKPCPSCGTTKEHDDDGGHGMLGCPIPVSPSGRELTPDECDRCLNPATCYGAHPVTGEEGQWCADCYMAGRKATAATGLRVHLVEGHGCLPDRLDGIDAEHYESMHQAAHEQDDPYWNGGHTHA